MSATRRAAATTIPPTQNTAPVHEYRCLYTHDVVRKQKRWQDGRVKYHTFNRRVMLYDDTLQFIGDTHCKEGEELSAGDHIKLDIGVLITLEDLLHTTQTDLAPLFDRDKSKQQHGATTPDAAPSQRPTSVAEATARPMQNANKQKHRSLNSLLNASRGAQGRASLHMQSPYDARKANVEHDWESHRAIKRRKTSNVSASRPEPSIIAALAGKETPATRSSNVIGHGPRTTNLALINGAVVDITSDVEVPLSDVTLPSSPKQKGFPATSITPVPMPAPKPVARTTRPSMKTAVANIAHHPVIRPSSPPISTKSKVRNVEALLSDELGHPTEDISPAEETPKATKTRTLRIAKTQQRPMLLCQKKPMPQSTVAENENAKGNKKKKERRSNLYQALSDSEDEQHGKQAQKLPKSGTEPTKVAHKKIVDLVSEASSSTAAFETGRSSSPTRTTAPRIQAPTTAKKPNSRPRNYGEPSVFEQEAVVGKSTLQMTQTDQAASDAKGATALTQARQHKQDDPKAKELNEVRKNQTKRPPVKKSVTTKSPAKKAARKTTKTKTLKNIIEKSNEIAQDIGEGIGSKAMEEKAKALAMPSVQREQGAWTVEATDLFEWRPPDWAQRAAAMDGRA